MILKDMYNHHILYILRIILNYIELTLTYYINILY